MNQQLIDRLRGEGISAAEFLAAYTHQHRITPTEKKALLNGCLKLSTRAIWWTDTKGIDDLAAFDDKMRGIIRGQAGIEGYWPTESFTNDVHQWDGHSWEEDGQMWYTAYDEAGNPYGTTDKPKRYPLFTMTQYIGNWTADDFPITQHPQQASLF